MRSAILPSLRSPLLPTPAEVEAMTPPGRDRSLDLVRLFALFVVITGHGVMLLVTFDGDTLRLGNLLSGSGALQALTWALQVLPLFFFAGAASSVLGWRAGSSWGRWLLRRAQRLYRPVCWYLLAWTTCLLALRGTVPAPVFERIASVSTQLLWFIGIYTVVLAVVPLLAKIDTGLRLWIVVAALFVAAAVVDVIRLRGGPQSIGLLNLAVWIIPAALGVGYVRNLISRPTAARVLVSVLAFDIALVAFGPHELSLVTVDGQRLSNMTPPSLLLAGHAIVLSCAFVLLAPWCARLAQRTRVWWLVAIGNGGAMTLYLWHMPALLVVVGTSHALGFDRSSPAQPGFGTLLVVQLAALYALTSVLFVALQSFENQRLPWWDRPVPELRGIRNVLVGAAVTLAGGAALAAAKWGLTGPGSWLTVAYCVALVVARAVAGHQRRYALVGSANATGAGSENSSDGFEGWEVSRCA